ncbi:MAG: hypothetical protein KDN18_16580 [Verrucomicrobiae bacterium]|nr:hypothetical protein [Verrucomicrobiae bacterium]
MKTPRQPRPDPAVAVALADMAAETAGLEAAAGGSITDTVARWLASRYATAAREQLEELSGESRMKFLGECVRDWSLLRHGDHTAARLQLERERLELARGLTESQIADRFQEWLERPAVKRLLNQGLGEEERSRRIRALFGLPEKPQPGLSPETLSKIEKALNLL